MLQFPVCHWSSDLGIPLFNGTDNNLRRGALDGVSPDKLAILFISFKPSAFGVIFHAGGIKITWTAFAGQNRIRIDIHGGILQGVADTNFLDNDEWGTLLIEFDMDDFDGGAGGEVRVAKVFINDKPNNFQTFFGNHGIAMPNNASINRIASSDADTGFFAGCIEKVWFSVGENVDLDNALNRLNWYFGNLNPKDLGPNGQNPTGTTPAIYMTADSIKSQKNLGTGGDFTRFGPAFQKCSTNPTDAPPDT